MPAPFLVLADFTPAADNALAYAAALAATQGAPLVLLHIRRESLLDPDAFTGSIRHLSEGQVAAALAERTRTLPVPATVESAVDGIEAAVDDAVRRHAPALVVLGKPDTESTPDELVSSTTLKLLRATRTPLLVVPAGSTAASVPPRRITLAADNEPFDLKSQLQGMHELLNHLQPQLTVLHVAAPEDDDTCVPALQAVQASGLLNGLPAAQGHSVRHRRLPEGILQGAADTRADLLLLIARRRSFLGQLFNRSVTAQVILHGRLPILLLPALD
ncbi:universal stress protein [Hymenobacter weizhouensis]|uniref:universal stress protein n=1 Tax=Hymenobacter sp. YIM 151500-1 TaxID=2987689 RepID=UPI0022272207|nr:universal stress protein [Hymenobacter sp. YIM 151500-1]UYZ64769.1 universal stress protein [Hymenobacter sp. YIM 151500-1]